MIIYIMKHKIRHSKRVVGAPNTNKEKVLESYSGKEWVIGHPLH